MKMDDNEKFELLREALLKIAYNNTKKLLSEYMKQINPDSYFPNATVEDLMIHIARQVVSMMDKKDGRNNYSFLEKKGKRYFCSYKCRGKRKWMKVWNKRAPEKRKCSFCKKLMSITPSQPHRQKKFCNNSCHTKWMWKNGKEPPTYLNGKWSMQHDCCKNCKGKNKRHFGKGLCMTCYNIQYNASKSPTKTLPERDDIV